MNKRLKIWLPLSLLLLVALWFVLPPAQKPAAQSTVKPAGSPAAAVAALTPASPAATNLAAKADAEITRSAASTNRLAFRLSNTAKTIGDLTTVPHAILLENALVDTDVKVSLKIPKHLQASVEPGAYIVQARGPTTAAFRSALAGAGAQIISYIPNNAYLVQLTGVGAGLLSANSQVQAVLPYEPYYKVQSSLLGRALEQKPLIPGTVLTLGLFSAGAESTVAQIQKLGGKVIATDRSPFGPVVRILPPTDWLTLAQLPGVMRVEPATRRQLANDLARVTMAISSDTVTNASWMGLTGSNVLVQVNDSGIDASHPDFSLVGSASAPGTTPPSRVTGFSANSIIDTNSHGTSVAGILAGNGSMSLSPLNVGSVASGSVTNADFRGKAPAALLYSVGIFGSETNVIVNDSFLQEAAALTNAIISNNSWSYGVNEYDLSAASYDAAVRDSLPETSGPQPVSFVFAAGNDGGGNNYGDGGDADSIVSPGTAKNVVTVGALEQFRNITNEVILLNGTTNAIWANATDSGTEVAAYSGRGNVGVQTEGTYGRVKPDVVAPGTFVVSTRPVAPMWDKAAYYNPTNYHNEYSQYGATVFPGNLAYGFGSVPSNTVGVIIKVEPNNNSPAPFPTNFPIYFSIAGLASPTNNNFSTSNNILSIPPGGGTITDVSQFLNSGFTCAVGDPTNVSVNFDLIIQIVTTNDRGNTLTVLSNLNETLAPYYFYESGTSMATPAVSGSLALLQEFFQSGRNPSLPTNPSPALLKAMLINGARLTAGYNNFAVTNFINYEGWGLVNVPNSLPVGISNSPAGGNPVPIFIQDQSPTNVLATGDSQTFIVAVPTQVARNQKLRLTLTWTDPPGNPAAALKLVNNLDLVVTNLDSGQVYYGNNFAYASEPFTPVANSNSVPDSVNNVENLWIQEPLGTNYSVTVVGRNIGVNAVTLNQTNIVQDYALVITCGDALNTNGIIVTPVAPAPVTPAAQLITYISSYTNGIYFRQLAGANAPWLSTNNVPFASGSSFSTNAAMFIGQTNQWHFFVVTNTTTYTNAAFIVFLANTLSTPRMGVFENSTDNATRPEADLNLFVAAEPDANAGSLTNLDYSVISNCVFNANGDQSSLSRGGTKFLVYSNSVRDRVYYVGVQCQDQMAAQFGFLSVFSENPFSQLNPDGSQTVNGLLMPVNIPDGSNLKPGVGYVVGLATYPMEVGDVTVTNTITHENFGDLIGILSHAGRNAVLNNHDALGGGTFDFVYNDTGQSGTVGTDGPGSLRVFTKKDGSGPWIMTQVDESQFQSGTIDNFTLNIKPNPDLEDGVEVTIGPQQWFYGYVDVPVGYTNMLVEATNRTQLPQIISDVQMYLNYNVEPSFTDYLVRADLTNGVPPGNTISYGPPLNPGTYWVGLYNPGTSPQTVFIRVKLFYNAAAISKLNFGSTGSIPLKDDAVTTNSIFVDATDRVQDMTVGLRVDHQRISDLTFTLIQPDGTRYLLMENRGGQTTNGCGVTVVSTNVVNVPSSGGASAQTNYIDVGTTSGTLPITYDFYTLADQMTIYYGTNAVNFTTNSPYLIYDSGMVSGSNTITVTFPPTNVTASSTYVTIIMNQFGSSAPTTAWNYTAGGIRTNFYYLSFTENTNLTTTPIKYAVPPFTPVITNYTVPLPVAPTNIPVLAGPITNPSNAHVYYLLANTNWTGSEIWAQAMGGHLVTINDATENDWVLNTFSTYGGINRNLWIGFYDAAQTNNTLPNYYIWSSGEPVTYSNWRPGEPNAPNTDYYVYMYSSFYSGVGIAGLWNNAGDIITNSTEPVLNGVVELNPVTVSSASNLYYLPEDDISGIQGINPHGWWTLEILDNRAGATNNATLVSWNLNFTFANTNYTTGINTNLGGTNYIPGGALQWFLINVPTNADIATNSLLFATLPLNLWWSTNVPPTITNSPADVPLLSTVTSGAALLGTNGSPINTTTAFITPGGTYYLGVQNPNVGGAYYALDVTFHLNLSTSGPTVVTEPATNIVVNAADLQGEVTPNSTNTTVYFDYGQTTNYGSTSASIVLTTNFTLPQWVVIGISNLPAAGVWHYRAVGYNIYGTNYGADLTFTNPYTVPPPYAFTMPATRVSGSSAQLNGMATPNGYAATAWFEWGTSPAYTTNTPPVSVGTNFNVVYVTNFLNSFVTNVAFHYRLVVSNEVGVTYGFDQVFAQGSVITWGANFFGQTTPLPAGLTNLVAGVGAGFDFSLALNYDGTVVAWGDNAAGQTNVPAGLNNAVAVAGGYSHSLALRSDRTVTVWGAGADGQTNVPPDLTNAVAAASGAYHCLALRDDGNPVAWGQDTSGQTNLPPGLSNVVAVAAGFAHSLALRNDGTVVAWGSNLQGQTNVPAGLSNVVAIAAGYYDSLALKGDGTVVAWGYNANGQTNVPASLTNVTAIAAGGYHCLALKGDGSVWFWGDSSSGQLNNYPPGLTNVFAIAGGGFHTVSVKAPFGLNVTNTAPYWTNGLNETIVTMNEQTSLSITNAALDSNAPPQLVFYSLVNAPAFVSIDSFTGVITANPSETNGPSTNTIITVAYDNGYPVLYSTNRFTLVVNEVNRRPFWPTNVPAATNFTIGVGQMLTVTNTASDPDVPINGLSYTNFVSPLNSAPTISSAGVISWTPTNAGNYTLTTIVTDSNPWALTNQNLSATNYLTVIVTNVPVPPPVVTNISIASIVFTNLGGSNGFLLTWFAPSNYLFQVQWNDNLASTNWQTFTNPSPVTYNTNYPASATNATFTFFDDGSQAPFTGMRFYRLVLLTGPANAAPVFSLGATATRFVTPTASLIVTNDATDANMGQTLTYALVSPPVGVNLDTNTGVITWTNVPLALAGTTNTTITTVVTDNGSPALSATNVITVWVNPLPSLTSVTFGTNGTTLQWTGWTNEQFQVQWTTNLVAPITWNPFPGIITSTNGTFSFVDTNSTLLMKFYQLILLP